MNLLQTFDPWKLSLIVILLLNLLNMSAAQSTTNDTKNMSNEDVLNKITPLVKSSDADEQLTGITLTRKWLFHPNRIHFGKDFVKRGFIPILVNGLKSTNQKMQYECAFLLAFFAEDGNNDAIVKAGAIPLLVNLIDSSDESVAEFSTLTLGHITVTPKHRQPCINAGIAKAFAPKLNLKSPLAFLQHATYAIKNLFNDVIYQPSKEVAATLLPGLVKLVQHEDAEVLKETLFAISYITSYNIPMVTKTGVAKKVILLLDHKDPEVQHGAIDVLGNIASGPNDYTQYILDIGALPLMEKFLKHSNKKLNKEACWFLMNFLAGSKGQIQEVFDAGYIPMIIKHLKNGDFDTQQKAAKCMLNAAAYGNAEHLSTIIDQGVIPALSSFMKVVEDKESKVIELGLQAIEKIVLYSPTRKNEMFKQFLKSGGLEVLKRLTKHRSAPVSHMATMIAGSLVATEHTTSFHYVGRDEM